MSRKLVPNANGEYDLVAYRYILISPTAGDDTGKCYVGTSSDEKTRITNWNKPQDDYAGQKINAARAKYKDRKNDWQYEVLERTTIKDEATAIKWLDDKETFYIAKFDSKENGFNGNLGGDGHKGGLTETHKANVKKYHAHYIPTQEHRDCISKKLRGRKRPPEECAKISKGNKGKKRTPEQRQAQSKRMKGKVPLEACNAAKEWRKKNPGWWSNHPISDEVKAKQKAIQQAKGKKIKAISTLDGDFLVFPTMLDAAKYFRIGVGSISHFLKTGRVMGSINRRFEEISVAEYETLKATHSSDV